MGEEESKGEEMENWVEDEERKGNEEEEKYEEMDKETEVELRGDRETDKCAAWVAKNDRYRSHLRLDENREEDEDEGEDEDEFGTPNLRRISPREAQAEAQRLALMKQKRHAKDFTFKSLKHFWNKVEEKGKETGVGARFYLSFF